MLRQPGMVIARISPCQHEYARQQLDFEETAQPNSEQRLQPVGRMYQKLSKSVTGSDKNHLTTYY